MSTFLNKTKGLWRKSTKPASVEKAVVVALTASPIQTQVGTMDRNLVQPEVTPMSLPYELLIHIMESIPILHRSNTLSSFRL